MLQQIPTYRNKCSLKLTINSDTKRIVSIVGFDHTQKNTDYFKREMFLKGGTQEFLFNMPQSPKKLSVYIFEPSQKVDNFNAKIKLVPLEQVALYVDQLTADFIKFSQWFSEKCGVLPIGDYTNKKKQFLIEYVNTIKDYDRQGNLVAVNTPSRIHKTNNSIQVEKSTFDKFTIPIRNLILLHEYSHNFLSKTRDNEVQADLNALNIYLSLGYPYYEAKYGFDNIFTNSSVNNARMQYIDNFLKKHNISHHGDFYMNNKSTQFNQFY